MAMKVPLLDMAAHHGPLHEEIMAALERVVRAGQFIAGPQVAELERQVAAVCGCAHAVAVSSGTDALLCSLMALGVGPGDEVITTPYTFFATAGAIWRVGARPVFVDIDPRTYNLDAARVEAAVTERTQAILPVHLFGQMASMPPLMDLARRLGLKVLEDAAQAIGASQTGRPAGSVGHAGCLSFFPSKNLGGLGDGGMITTNDAELAEKLRVFRVHGSKPKYFHGFVGGNFRLDTLQAAALLVKLPHLPRWTAARQAHARRYSELLGGLDRLLLPVVDSENVSVFNQYVVRTPRRDALAAHLGARGIGTAIYYPVSLHEQACFASLGHRTGDFPESEAAARETLAIPVFPEMTEEQQAYVASSVAEALEAGWVQI